MSPRAPTSLEKTIIAQEVHQKSSAGLLRVAKRLNEHPLITLHQPQVAGEAPWTERAVKLAYVDMLDAHIREDTREALLDEQDIHEMSAETFPFIAARCSAATQVVNACFSEYYVEVDTRMRNRELDLLKALRKMKRAMADEPSDESERDESEVEIDGDADEEVQHVRTACQGQQQQDADDAAGEEDSASASEDGYN